MSRPPSFRFAARLCSVAVIALLGACGRGQNGEGGSSAGSPPPAPRFAAVVLQPSPAASGLSATGTVLAEQEVDVRTEISGRVIHIGFREGEPVRAGQVLIRLDGEELRAQADRAAANLTLTRTRAARLQQDFEAQAVSRNELDRAVAEWKAAEAEAALARARWEKATLRAPFSGIAGLREVELGAVLQPGARVTTLQNLNSLRVDFSVPERLAGGVHAGMKVRFTAAGTADTLEAEVYAVESRVDPDTRLLRVRARTVRPVRGSPVSRSRVLPGAFARVELPMRAAPALWVPTEAVVQSAQGSQVWLARGGVAERRVFVPGQRTPTAVEAVSGLEAGDTVFVSGILQLRPGAPAVPVVQAAESPDPEPAETP